MSEQGSDAVPPPGEDLSAGEREAAWSDPRRAYAHERLERWCKRRGVPSGPAHDRLADLLRAYGTRKDQALGQSEWDGLIDQVEVELAEPPQRGPPVEPCKDFSAAVEVLRAVVRTKDPSGSVQILNVMAQDYVLDFLDSTVYLGFKGRSGAGKGTALESAILLARDGQVLSVTTPADLSAALAEKRAIGIPEADSLIHKDPIVAKILRDGYRRGNVYGFMVPLNGKEWKRETRDLFGVKVFDFHVSFDAHVLGRSIVLEMEPDNSVDLAMDAEKKARRLAPVRAYLAREAERIRRDWTKEKTDGLWDDPKFRAEVRDLGGKVGRDHVVGANLLLVARLFGWDLKKELRRAMRGRRTLDDLSEESEVADAIRELAGQDGAAEPTLELPTALLLEHLNAQRAKLRMRTLTPQGLGSILGDLGFKRDEDLVKATSGPNRGKNVLLPCRFLRELAQLAHLAQPTLDGPGSRDEKPQSGTVEPAAPDAPEAPQGPIMEESGNWTVSPKDRARPKDGES